MEENESQRAILYTKSRLDYVFFSSACTAILQPNRLILSSAESGESIEIRGEGFVLRKLRDNLSCGVDESVLKKLLSFCAVPGLFEKLKEGRYIE